MSTLPISAALRRMSPAWVDTRVYSCFSVLPKTLRRPELSASFSTSQNVGTESGESPNKDFKINPLFENRNPRNLELMGLARKRQGWVLQAPRKDFYHRVLFERSNRHTTGRVEHFSGKTVISASTAEWAIKEGLYSLVDVSAAENIGRILAQRCLESGITEVFYDGLDEHQTSEKMQAFLGGLQEVGLDLEETAAEEPYFVPGVDYSREHRVGERKKWKDDYQPL
ncbi:hypothetical protein BaRGS_00020532 [Batillaria attramentaria]|uniref:Large ribosomal subunit protein uL18m n=1 Tax=Batillaria attramentaria TaxID=370345 RepID=A0ABD0KMJ5_9CAEN